MLYRMDKFHEKIEEIIRLLKEAGYEPYSQLEGYAVTGNLSYITKYGDARNKILEIDRAELLYYLDRIMK